MILGAGEARTDEAIIAEYHAFLQEYKTIHYPDVLRETKNAPYVMMRRIGKPILQWNDEDLLKRRQQSQGTRRYRSDIFFTFLLFRGYYHATLPFMEALDIDLTRLWSTYLQPWRNKIMETGKALGYGSEQTQSRSGSLLSLLILLMVVTRIPLEELTRETFEAFRDEYQASYRKKNKNGSHNVRLSRLERYLEHWGILPPAKNTLRYEEYIAQLCHEAIRSAVLTYMKWASVKYRKTTLSAKRTSILLFFLWLQQQFPCVDRLDGVIREIAMSYMHYLKQRMEAGCYGRAYVRELHCSIRLFFDFAIEEDLEMVPHRNPFSSRDVPQKQDGIPRYLSDQEIQSVLTYCKQQASLREGHGDYAVAYRHSSSGTLPAEKIRYCPDWRSLETAYSSRKRTQR